MMYNTSMEWLKIKIRIRDYIEHFFKRGYWLVFIIIATSIILGMCAWDRYNDDFTRKFISISGITTVTLSTIYVIFKGFKQAAKYYTYLEIFGLKDKDIEGWSILHQEEENQLSFLFIKEQKEVYVLSGGTQQEREREIDKIKLNYENNV